MSTEGPGFVPSPWQVIGAARPPKLSADTGSPIVQITEVIFAMAVTETAPAVTVADTTPGSSTHRYNQYFTAIRLGSGPKFIEGSGIDNS